MGNWLRNVFTAKYFFSVILSLFVIQGLWFAISIKPGIPADEIYHFEFIKFYSNRPLLEGPVIRDQGKEHFKLADLEREPSYFYHYLLSFPQRVIENLGVSRENNIIVLRIITLLFSIGSIFALRKILRLATKSAPLQNSVTAMTSLVGMFIWISASVNYDSLSLLLFLLLILNTLTFLQKKSLISLILIPLLVMVSIITKYTFLPATGLIFLLLLFYLRKERWLTVKEIKSLFYREKVRLKSPVVIIAVLGLTVSLAMFTERTVKNVVVYGQATPSCNKIHTEAECLQSALYARNFNQTVKFKEFKENGGSLKYNPVTFTASWAEDMYGRLYFYFGHKSFAPKTNEQLSLGLLATLILIALLIKKRPLLQNREEKLLMIVTIFYILQLLIYNTGYYLTVGAKFGFQGRYLLPIVPFILYFIIKLLIATKDTLNTSQAKVFTLIAVLILSWFTYKHLPFTLFIARTDSNWYTSNTVQINTSLKEIYKKIPDLLTNL